jgi:hypothetical protein
VLQNTSDVLKHLPVHCSGAREAAGHKGRGHPSADGSGQDYCGVFCAVLCILSAHMHRREGVPRPPAMQRMCRVRTHWHPRPPDAPAVIETLAAMHAKQKKMPLQRSLARPMRVMALLTLPPWGSATLRLPVAAGLPEARVWQQDAREKGARGSLNPSNVHVAPCKVYFLVQSFCWLGSALQGHAPGGGPLDVVHAPLPPHRPKPSAATAATCRACRRPAAAPQC